MLVGEENCRGYIGRSAGTKICLEIGCDTPSHRAEQLEVGSEGIILIRVPRRNQAFTSPTLPVDKLPLGFKLDALEDEMRPAEALRAIMLSGISRVPSPPTMDLFDEFIAIPSATNPRTPDKGKPLLHPGVRGYKNLSRDEAFAQASKDLRTPARLERTFMDVQGIGLLAGSNQGLDSLDSLEDLVQKGSKRSEIPPNDPAEQVELLRQLLAEVDLVGAATVEVGGAHKDLWNKVHAAVDAIDAKFL